MHLADDHARQSEHTNFEVLLWFTLGRLVRKWYLLAFLEFKVRLPCDFFVGFSHLVADEPGRNRR